MYFTTVATYSGRLPLTLAEFHPTLRCWQRKEWQRNHCRRLPLLGTTECHGLCEPMRENWHHFVDRDFHELMNGDGSNFHKFSLYSTLLVGVEHPFDHLQASLMWTGYWSGFTPKIILRDTRPFRLSDIVFLGAGKMAAIMEVRLGNTTETDCQRW
jgi:hypothetical protein